MFIDENSIIFCSFRSKYSSKVHVSFLLSVLNTAKRDQNIVLGYVYPNFEEGMRNKVYPSKSKFNCIKLEFKGGLNYIGVLASYSTIST